MSSRQHLVLWLIVALGAAVRLTYLLDAVNSPGFVWEDPDKYMTQAFHLVRRGEWHWTFNAVVYSINGQRHALPPGYSVFLSLFTLFPGLPVTALVAQALLAVASIPLVFSLGRQIHSVAAGLIAAGGFAVWVPNIFNVWSTSQETLYIPLILITFVLLARAIDHDAGPLAFAIAGLVCGAAALTRSMPMFFVLPAAGLHVALARERRRAAVQAAAFIAGVLVLTVPYSVALSRYFGAVTVIDTHGSIHLDASGSARTPDLIETARGLSAAVAASPAQYVRDCVQRVGSILHVNGGRVLQIYVVAGSRWSAVFWKCVVHLGTDALLLFAVLLAPIGAVICRRPRIAVMLLLWTAVNIAVAALGGFGGARLRTPFEPLLLVLAATACVPGWRRPHPLGLGAALAITCLAAIAVVPQLDASLRAWPDYGVKWPSIFSRQTGHFIAAAGLNVPATDGAARLAVAPAGDSPVQLHVRANGVIVRTVQLSPGDLTSITTPWPARGLAFIEFEATGPQSRDADILVVMAGQ
jgi:hypothetical protein